MPMLISTSRQAASRIAPILFGASDDDHAHGSARHVSDKKDKEPGKAHRGLDDVLPDLVRLCEQLFGDQVEESAGV